MQTWFAPLKPIRINEKEQKLLLSTYAGGDMLISYIETRYIKRAVGRSKRFSDGFGSRSSCCRKTSKKKGIL